MIDEETGIDISLTADLFEGRITGIIIDENEDPLEGVTATIGEEETLTNENGYFQFDKMSLDAYGTAVRFEKDGYWSVTKLISLSKDQVNYTQCMLTQKGPHQTITASTGGQANFDDIIKIDFPENAFVTEQGNQYSGDVRIEAVHLDPSDPSFGMISPGDFRAFNSDNELRTLQSYGMAGVELFGSDGESLQLASDIAASLSIKAPEWTELSEIPLWHFDETIGYWIEEGSASLEGDYFVGDVAHFSWWNCDIPFSAVKLSGMVLNETNVGVSGLPVTIIMEDNMSNLGVEYTGQRGLFCGWIPKGESLIIQIHDECGNLAYEDVIGPFEEDVQLDPIFIDSETEVTVCGQALNCDEEPVTNGYLVVVYENQNRFIPLDASGQFCTSINTCGSESVSIYVVDINAGLQGFASTYQTSDGPFSDLILRACDEIAHQFIFKINNEAEVVVNDFRVELQNGQTLFAYGNEEINGVYPGFIIDGVNWGLSDFTFGYYNLYFASSNSTVETDVFIGESFDLDVIEYGGIGNLISLSIEGVDDFGQSYTVAVTGILEEGE